MRDQEVPQYMIIVHSGGRSRQFWVYTKGEALEAVDAAWDLDGTTRVSCYGPGMAGPYERRVRYYG